MSIIKDNIRSLLARHHNVNTLSFNVDKKLNLNSLRVNRVPVLDISNEVHEDYRSSVIELDLTEGALQSITREVQKNIHLYLPAAAIEHLFKVRTCTWFSLHLEGSGYTLSV